MIIRILSLDREPSCPYTGDFHVVWPGDRSFNLTRGPCPVPFILDEADDFHVFEVQFEKGMGLGRAKLPFRGVVWSSGVRDELPFLEYGCTCMGAPHEARLYFQPHPDADSQGIGRAPQMDLLPEEDDDEQAVVNVTLQSSSGLEGVSSALSSVQQATPTRYLVLPGNYSGDSWACVAAMLLDPQIKVVLTAKDDIDDAESDYDKIAAQFYEFATTTTGVADPQGRILKTIGGLGQHGSAASVGKQAEAAITKDARGGNPKVGWTFASTSVIMHAAERMGVQALRAKLVSAFTEADAAHAKLAQRIAEAGPCVILNMRVGRGGNHPQHNMTPDIYAQLRGLVRSFGFKVVRVGTYQDSTWTPGAGWMADLQAEEDGVLIDLFPSGVRSNRKHVAYFWSEVAKLQNVIGVIGGRSGSLDVAAFMGVRSLCWDICQRNDAGFHEYVRQVLMYPLMSICRRQVPAHRTSSGHYFDQKKPCPALALHRVDVILWLAGHHILPTEPFQDGDIPDCLRLNDGVFHGREGMLLRPLEYIASLFAQADEDEQDLPDIDEGELGADKQEVGFGKSGGQSSRGPSMPPSSGLMLSHDDAASEGSEDEASRGREKKKERKQEKRRDASPKLKRKTMSSVREKEKEERADEDDAPKSSRRLGTSSRSAMVSCQYCGNRTKTTVPCDGSAMCNERVPVCASCKQGLQGVMPFYCHFHQG